jgi:superfamily II DNA or RNA helicase
MSEASEWCTGAQNSKRLSASLTPPPQLRQPTRPLKLDAHLAVLAVKMSIQFGAWFANYQNVEGLIQDAKVVTCLDSLYRVATRNFDYIIMDECVHVPALQQLVP